MNNRFDKTVRAKAFQENDFGKSQWIVQHVYWASWSKSIKRITDFYTCGNRLSAEMLVAALKQNPDKGSRGDV